MGTITLIQDPPFQVDFKQYIAKEKTKIPLRERVQNVALGSLALVRVAFTSVGKSAYVTLSYAGKSFKHIVLGYYGSLWSFRPPRDIYLAIFKVFIWVGSMAWCFTITSIRQIRKEIAAGDEDQSFLQQYAGNEIDVSHIQSKEIEIDVSAVPAKVKVDQLLKMFDQINFTRPDQPGYMAPGSRSEGRDPYSVEGLRESLERFVRRVNQREAFLATPPGYDTPRLFAFYQQIENAVRFSIHKVESDLEKFRLENGEDISTYTDPLKREYKNLLEERARVPLNLAIAGYHCGARYMGESMELYSSLKGEGLALEGTLQDTLIELLANKRKKIAEKHIQIYLGHDTHDYTIYIANLGQELAIPGTANVTETFRTDFDRTRFLKRFFDEYSVDCIIDTIQDKVRHSQLFREKITDWLKDQVGDWNRSREQDQKLLQQAQKILSDQRLDNDLSIHRHFDLFIDLLDHLQAAKLPDHPDPQEFFAELFLLPEAKAWFEGQMLNPLETAKLKKAFRDLCSERQLGPNLVQQIKDRALGKSVAYAKYKERLLFLQKVGKIRVLTGIEEEIVQSIVKGKKSMEVALNEYHDRDRRNEFLNRLPLEGIEKGLKPEMIEWILVSQKILRPQGE